MREEGGWTVKSWSVSGCNKLTGRVRGSVLEVWARSAAAEELSR